MCIDEIQTNEPMSDPSTQKGGGAVTLPCSSLTTAKSSNEHYNIFNPTHKKIITFIILLTTIFWVLHHSSSVFAVEKLSGNRSHVTTLLRQVEKYARTKNIGLNFLVTMHI